MAGDFNMVLNELDRYPQLMRKKCALSEKFKKLLNRLNVEDLWRVLTQTRRSLPIRLQTTSRTRDLTDFT